MLWHKYKIICCPLKVAGCSKSFIVGKLWETYCIHPNIFRCAVSLARLYWKYAGAENIHKSKFIILNYYIVYISVCRKQANQTVLLAARTKRFFPTFFRLLLKGYWIKIRLVTQMKLWPEQRKYWFWTYLPTGCNNLFHESLRIF